MNMSVRACARVCGARAHMHGSVQGHSSMDANQLGPLFSLCLQGLVQLTPANEWTGGFCVVPGSHKYHDEFSKRHPHRDVQGDFLPVPEGDPIVPKGSGLMLRADPGDIILWDSRTIHCNGPAIEALSRAPASVEVPARSDLLRLVGYVCCVPAAWATPSLLEQRAQAVLEKTTSTHWPQAFVPTGYRPKWESPRTPADYTDAEARLILGNHGR